MKEYYCKVNEAPGGTMRDDLEIRRALWASHPCEGKYGDDGELQCGRYLPPIDFLRDDWQMLGRKIASHTKAMLQEQWGRFREKVEKLVLPKYKKSWDSDGESITDVFEPVSPEDTRQTILSLLDKEDNGSS